MEEGCIAVEVEQFGAAFKEQKAESPLFRLDIQLVGRSNEILWSSSKTNKVSSKELTGFTLPVEAEEGKEAPILFTVGCNMTEKTNFVDMNEKNVNDLVNSYLVVKILSVAKNDDAVAAAPAKGKPAKGAPATSGEAAEDVLAEAHYHLASLIKEKSGSVEYYSSFDTLKKVEPRTVVSDSLDASSSFLNLRLNLDNGFMEYIAEGNILQWEVSSVKRMPLDWCIPIASTAAATGKAPKGKGKGPAAEESEEEVRSRQLEAIAETLGGQSSLVQYTMQIQPPAAGGGEEARDEDSPLSALPAVEFAGGRLEFDSNAAVDCSVSEITPLQNNPHLWSLHWGPSPLIFLHRSTSRALSAFLSAGGASDIAVIIKKSPPPAPDTPAAPVKGKGEAAPEPIKSLVAHGTMDIRTLCTPDARGLTFEFTAAPDNAGEGSTEGDVVPDVILVGEAAVMLDRPLVIATTFPAANILPVDAISLKQVGGEAMNRDVKKELRTEIQSIVKEIAQEYVSLYPQPAGEGEMTAEQRRGHFMYHLSNSGIYHRLKETLKPRIQRVVRERYGARNRALGNVEKSVPSVGFKDAASVPMDELIGELYVVLVKECNTVLNGMYKNTIVARDTEELEKAAVIDDEKETPQQKFFRLFKLALDAEADRRYYQSEQLHLERIQLLELEVLLNTDPQAPHHAYFQMHEYLLRRAADALISDRVGKALGIKSTDDVGSDGGDDMGYSAVPEAVEDIRLQAREFLEHAIKLKGNHWMSHMQMGCLLLESNQQERAGEFLMAAINLQLEDKSSDGDGWRSFDQFQGYESDQLCPVHPLSYIMLSLYFTKLEQPLNARKAIRLAIRSFADGEFEPPISTHGKPRRTAVLCLCQAAVFLFDHGLCQLGDLCCNFALDCEAAASRKAEERNLPACTVPTIRHLLKKSEALSTLFRGNAQAAYDLAMDSVAVAVADTDVINGNLCAAKCANFQTSTNSVDTKIAAYSAALRRVGNECGHAALPLADYVEAGKALLSTGRFEDALDVMLLGCRVYPSSTLFNLVGICCLRVDRMVDAEDALQEANLIDNRNPEVWAYLAILCLHTGDHRMEEAERSCEQALRLGLNNSAILREIAMAFISVDKLRTAEELVRRSMASDLADGAPKPNSHTRRLLGDILAGQNQAVEAIEEYQSVIGDEDADLETRLLAGEKCSDLLSSLGRTEELNTLDSILETLSANA